MTGTFEQEVVAQGTAQRRVGSGAIAAFQGWMMGTARVGLLVTVEEILNSSHLAGGKSIGRHEIRG